MSFYKEINPFIDYLKSVRRLKNYLSFDMLFPATWGLPKSYKEDGQIVPFDSEEGNLRGFSFVSETNEKEISQTLLKVAKLIKLNKEREMKDLLFKQTIEQLKKTFEQNDLEKLQKLQIEFQDNITEIEITNEQDGEKSTTIELAE
jgi:hypothetical protein